MMHVTPKLLSVLLGLAFASTLSAPIRAYNNPELADQFYQSARAHHELVTANHHAALWSDVAHYYAQAASAGHPDAQVDLGYLLLTQPGDFGPRFRSPQRQGYERLMKAVGEGDRRAMVLLAYALEHGMGVKADTPKAHQLYERAAAAGSTGAMRRLAEISADEARGYGWLERAARAGDAQAMIDLARRLAGPGPVHNPEQARAWLERARDAEHPDAIGELAMLDRTERALAAENRALVTQVDGLLEDLTRAQSDLDSRETAIQRLSQESEALMATVADREQALERAQDQLRVQGQAVLSGQSRIDQLLAQSQALESQLAAEREQAQTERGHWSQVEQALAASHARTHELQAQVADLDEQRAALVLDLKNEQEGMNGALERLSQAEQALSQRSHQLSEHQDQVQALKALAGQLRNQLDETGTREQALASELGEVRAQLEASNQDAMAATAQLKKAEDEVALTQQLLLASQLQTNELASTLGELESAPAWGAHHADPADLLAPDEPGAGVGMDLFDSPGESAYRVAMKLTSEGDRETALSWLQAAADNGHQAALDELDAYHREVFRERTTGKGVGNHE